MNWTEYFYKDLQLDFLNNWNQSAAHGETNSMESSDINKTEPVRSSKRNKLFIMVSFATIGLIILVLFIP